jgi:hypothetical protein
MKNLNSGLLRQARLHFARIALLSLLFTAAAAACSPSAAGAAPAQPQTAAPTSARLSPTAAAAAGASAPPAAWKPYTSPALQVALDYPADWQIKPDASGVTFSSNSGASIKLLQLPTGDLSPQAYLNQSDLPNTRCSQRSNPYGLSTRVCLDTLSFSTMAQMITGSGGNSRLVALVMGKNGDKAVFDAMLQTVRVIP